MMHAVFYSNWKELQNNLKRYFEQSLILFREPHLLRQILLLLCFFTLIACTSSGKLPNAQESEELASFSLSTVSVETIKQPVITDTNTISYIQIYTAKVFSTATGEPVEPGVPFQIYDGNQLLATTQTNSERTIRWQKIFSVESGGDYDYSIYNFRIVANGREHRGTRTKKIQINPGMEGHAAAVDITDGSVQHVQTVAEKDKKKPDFQIEKVEMESNFPIKDSVSTGKPSAYQYLLRACLFKKIPKNPALEAKQKFLVKGFGEQKSTETETDERGCILFPAKINNFQYFSQERWFKESIEICGANNIVDNSCKKHIVYIDPWEERRAQLLFANGRFLEGAAETPPSDLIDGQIPQDKQKPPKIILASGYVLNFLGRNFSIDNNLAISSQRNYDIVLFPKISRFTKSAGYKSVPLETGKFRIKLLVLKAQGDSYDNFSQTELGKNQYWKQAICYAKDNIYDIVADLKIRRDCYAQSFIDYKEDIVEIKGGELRFPTAINFSDLRYVHAMNLLYLEIEPYDVGENSGIPTETVVSTFYPLEQTGRRRIDNLEKSVFIQHENKENQYTKSSRFTANDIWQMLDNAKWKKEELSAENIRILNDLTKNTSTPIQNGDADPTLNKDYEKNGVKFTPDNATTDLHQQYLAIAKNLTPESVTEIMQYIREADLKNKTKTTAPTVTSNILPTSIQEYMLANNLRYISTKDYEKDIYSFHKSDLDKLFQNITNRSQYSGTPSKITGILKHTYEITPIINKACEALYPDTTSDDSKKEAAEFADRAYKDALYSFQKQREILCKLNDIVAAKSYDNVDLDPAKIRGCEDKRPLCFHNKVSAQESKQLWPGVRFLLNNFPSLTDNRPTDVCPVQLPDSETALINAILTDDQNIIQDVLNKKVILDRSIIETLAAEYLPLMHFTRVRAEVAKQQYPEYRLDNIIMDPKSLDKNNPKHRKMAEAFIPTPAQIRCKRNPEAYLGIDLTEHVTEIVDRPLNIRAGSSSIGVGANISLSYSENRDENTLISKGSSLTTAGEVGMNFAGGLQIVGYGSVTASQRIDSSYKASATAQQVWQISQTTSKGSTQGSNLVSSLNKSLDAEEITFKMKAMVQRCLSIQKKNPITKSVGYGGILFCEDDAKTQEITETWWYVYLYFLNSHSAILDTPTTFVMRPWTTIIRGQEQFDIFRNLLQNTALNITITPREQQHPDNLLSSTFLTHSEYRKTRDIPGLLHMKRLELKNYPLPNYK